MSLYPKLVERFLDKTGSSLELGCNACEQRWKEDEPEAAMAMVDHGACPTCGSFDIAFAYVEGDRCPNCGRVAFDACVIGGCCSRACMLQHEYAQQLADVVPISAARGRKRRRTESPGPHAA